MKILFQITLTLSVTCATCSLKTDYYEKLINKQTSEAENYQFPANNEEFKAGIGSNNINDYGSYDFIIIGAGAGGSTLATRLSEIENFNILLLESGGEENDFNRIPFMQPYAIFTKMNWGYSSIPQKKCCLGMKNRQCLVPRGKVTGGSTAINVMLYVRGNPDDYNKWEKLGNPGWSYREVLPYFIKSENSQINGDEGFHGKQGFWNVEYPIPSSPLFSTFINGSAKIIGLTEDYNGVRQIGSSRIQYSTICGKRESIGTAFLDHARKRRNLKVITKALATKIIINTKTRTAIGVEFVTKNQKFFVKAKKEVVVSAGAYNSPQLLMLSGIGPEGHLKQLGIPVLADLPVGKHLMEHPMFPGLVFRTNFTVFNQTLKKQVKEYLQGVGVLTKARGTEGVGFINTEDNRKEVPNIEYIFSPPSGNATPITTKVSNYNEEVSNFFRQINPNTDVQFFIILLHEKSRGEVTLKSASPLDFSNVNLNLLEEKQDVDTFIKGIKFILQLAETKAFQKINARPLDIPFCMEFQKNSDKFWECILRYMTATIDHPCGTTRMGPNESTAVVDHNLKVHGFRNLRVVDAGILPSSTSGHLAATVVMIAEKIADVIKREYGS